MKIKKKSKKKSKQRVLVEGPKVSDPVALKNFDRECQRAKDRAEEDRMNQSRRFGGYDLDPQAAIAAMMTLSTMAKRRSLKHVVESDERTYNKDEEEQSPEEA